MSKSYEVFGQSIPLMMALAKMAGMEQAGIRRMVLVLDVKAQPTLYIESYMRHEVGSVNLDDLPATPLVVKEGCPEVVGMPDPQILGK